MLKNARFVLRFYLKMPQWSTLNKIGFHSQIAILPCGGNYAEQAMLIFLAYN